MPSLRDIAKNYLIPVAPAIVGGVLNRRAAGSAQNALTTGADTAANTLQSGANQAIGTITGGATGAQKTLADIYGEQKGLLDPFRKAGESTLPALTEGTAKGGEFNSPFDASSFDLYKDPSFNWRVEQGLRAIKAGGNAAGIRFSGSTLKTLSDYNQQAASQEYQNAFNRRETDLTGRFNRLMDLEGAGQNAANQEVAAGGTFGTNTANLQAKTGEAVAGVQKATAEQIADLQTQKASAEAAGDVAKANAIGDMISGAVSGVMDQQLINKFLSGAPAAGLSLASAAPAALPLGTLPSASLGFAGLAPGAAGAGAAGVAPGALAPVMPAANVGAGFAAPTSSGASTLGQVGAFMTNPITIGAAVAIVGIASWLKSQAHHEASTFVSKFQDPFRIRLESAVNGFRSALAGGADPQSLTSLRNQIAAATQEFERQRQDFAKGGKDEAKVASQARATMDEYFGQNFSKLLGDLDRDIQGASNAA